MTNDVTKTGQPAGPRMDEETRMTARLPNLDIEIRHRDEGEAGEVLTLRMHAHPNLDAAVAGLLPALSAAAMPWAMPSMMAGPVPANPFAAWMRLTALAWQPWLAALPDAREKPET